MTAASKQDPRTGTPVRLKRADHPEIRYGHVADPPTTPTEPGYVCVRFPSGFWGWYDPARLVVVDKDEWGSD